MNINNLSILVNKNNNDVLDEYFLYYLSEIVKISKKTFLVLSKNLKDKFLESIKKINVDLIVCDKNLTQHEIYKYAINKIGYEEIKKYDNLILSNNSFYGPFRPLEEMFEVMSEENCDYWTLYEENTSKSTIFKGISRDFCIGNSDFIVFKKVILNSIKFKEWWKKRYSFKKNKDYEIKQDLYFKKHNFNSSAFIKYDKYKNITKKFDYCVAKIIESKKLPIIPKTSLFKEYSITVEHCLTHQTNDIINFIKSNTNYDIELIFKDIIKNKKMSEIKENLHLNYILPTDIVKKRISGNRKIALVMYIYYEDLVNDCFKYIQSMPDNSDIFLVSSKEETLNNCKEKATSLINNYNFEYRLKENRGRDVSAYLVTCADVFQKYDYICCMHDKKSPHIDSLLAEDFAYQCFECNLSTKDYVKNIINTFEENPKMGLLVSPNMYFWDYLNGYRIKGNKEYLLRLYNKLNLSIPFDETPVAPYGSMFWIRKEAIQPLFRHKWEYKDFPQEPLSNDGTISHAIERIYPTVAQDAGYLSGWIIPDKFCSMYIHNLKSAHNLKYVRIKNNQKQNSILKNIFSICNVYIENEKYKEINIFYNTFYKQIK